MSTTRYNVVFSVDGSMTIAADSVEEAERLAIEELEMLRLDCDATVDGCSVRVALQFSYDEDDEPDECTKVERPSHVVEFA